MSLTPSHPKISFLLDNSKNKFVKYKISFSEIVEKCVVILRFFPEYLRGWSLERQKKFVSFIIQDEIETRPDLDKLVSDIYIILNQVEVVRWNTLSECSHCGDFIHDPMKLPSGESVDKDCIDIFDKVFSVFASPVTDVELLTKISQVEYNISIAVHRISRRTLFFSHSVRYGQRIGFVIQSLILRYPEFGNRFFYTETGKLVDIHCQDMVSRISGLYVIQKTIHPVDKIGYKLPDSFFFTDKTVHFEPWWMFYHLLDYLHSDIKPYSYVRSHVNLNNNNQLEKLEYGSSYFFKTCAHYTRYVEITDSVCHKFRCRKKTNCHLMTNCLNRYLYLSDSNESTTPADAYLMTFEGVNKIMSRNAKLQIPWDQSDDYGVKFSDSLDFIVGHSENYTTIIVFLFNDISFDASFKKLVNVELSSKQVVIFVPKVFPALQSFVEKYSLNVAIFNISDYHEQIKNFIH